MDEELYMLLRDAKLLEYLGVLAAGYTTKYKTMTLAYKTVVKLVLDHNLISSSLSIKEMMLFRNLLTAVERKMSAGAHKFTWAEELNESYATECIKSLKELHLFLIFYKKVCDEIVHLCEQICCTHILHIKTSTALELPQVKDRLNDSAESARLQIFKMFQVIVGYSLNLFERFSQKTTKVSKAWIEFVQRIDSLLQESLLACIESSLDKFAYLMTGSGSFRSEPIINFDVKVEDKKKITIRPPLAHLSEFLQSLLCHLSEVFLLNLSLSRQFDKGAAIGMNNNKKIIVAIEKTRAELEKYLLLWKPRNIYKDVMQEVTGGAISTEA